MSEQRLEDIIIGDSEPIAEVRRWIEMVGRSDATAMIHGEPGTGKNLVARTLHDISPRRDKPFVQVNCGALPAELLDSELFGHEEGAFAGAKDARPGRFELAHGGTLCLDEIEAIEPATQVRLLRVLQEREITPVGSDKNIPVDVRVIAVTRLTQDELLSSGFREDLFYRLNVVPITIPPLRSRSADIPALTRHFIAKERRQNATPTGDITPTAVEQLTQHSWPGNVRELAHVVMRAHSLADGSVITTDHLPDSIHDTAWGGLDTLIVTVDRGTAPKEEIAAVLAEISILYRMMGGSGINFSVQDVEAFEGMAP